MIAIFKKIFDQLSGPYYAYFMGTILFLSFKIRGAARGEYPWIFVLISYLFLIVILILSEFIVRALMKKPSYPIPVYQLMAYLFIGLPLVFLYEYLFL